MTTSTRLATLRRELARRRQEVEGLSYDTDFSRFPQIREALQRPRRKTILVGITWVAGVSLLSALLLPWYITFFLVPAATGVSWLHGHRSLDRAERRVFDQQRQNMLQQIPAQLDLTPAICDVIARLPEWFFIPSSAAPAPGAMAAAEPAWRDRVRILIQAAVAAVESLNSVHRRGLIPAWVQSEGEVPERAELALVPLLARAASLADLFQAVSRGSPEALATAESMLRQLEEVSRTLQEAAALAVRCATSPQEAELKNLRQQMANLDQASRIWQEANREL